MRPACVDHHLSISASPWLGRIAPAAVGGLIQHVGMRVERPDGAGWVDRARYVSAVAFSSSGARLEVGYPVPQDVGEVSDLGIVASNPVRSRAAGRDRRGVAG